MQHAGMCGWVGLCSFFVEEANIDRLRAAGAIAIPFQHAFTVVPGTLVLVQLPPAVLVLAATTSGGAPEIGLTRAYYFSTTV